MSAINAVTTTKGEARIDSRLIADHLGIKNRSLYALVKSHKADFEQLGILRFQNAVIKRRGQPEKYALLNEDQAYLFLAFSRNTKKVCTLKLALVKSFGEARRALSVRQIEYLPAYHALHDAIKIHADGSANERFYHMNANRELNKLAGVQAGHRASAGLLQQSLLAVGSALAARAVTEANEGSLHQHIKAALKPLEGVLAIGCS
jgi:phage regulator Rha-like protein